MDRRTFVGTAMAAETTSLPPRAATRSLDAEGRERSSYPTAGPPTDRAGLK